MYLKRIHLENVGPIEKLEIEMPLYTESAKLGQPKPLILVGQNGSGKSTVLSFIVDALFCRKTECFPDDSEIKRKSSFRVRGDFQIKNREKNYFSGLYFDENERVKERKDKNSKINRDIEIHKESYSKGVFLFFPPNRFEEPSWSQNHILYKENFFKSMTSWEESDRKIIQQSPLGEIKSWILNILYDANALKSQGAKYLTESLEKIIQDFLGFSEEVGFDVDYRGVRSLGISQIKKNDENKKFVSDLFSMSSGQVSLFCIFCAILRDADLANLFSANSDDSKWKKLEDIEGIVVIDEIDLHLHTKMQSEILPKLIDLFPKIQFIITTHSPLFLLGMERLFDQKGVKEGIEIRELPSGNKLDYAKHFGEYADLKDFMKEKDLDRHLRKKIDSVKKSREGLVVFVEGQTDEKYLKKAIEFKGEGDANQNLFSQIKIETIGDEEGNHAGHGALKRFGELYKNNISENDFNNSKVLLLFDCDVGAIDETISDKKLYKKGIPKMSQNLINSGIENLFPSSITGKTKVRKFFAKVYQVSEEGGKSVSRACEAELSKNSGSKTNLCDWICQNATADDFKHFDQIFKIIEEVLKSDQNTKNIQNQTT